MLQLFFGLRVQALFSASAHTLSEFRHLITVVCISNQISVFSQSHTTQTHTAVPTPAQRTVAAFGIHCPFTPENCPRDDI